MTSAWKPAWFSAGVRTKAANLWRGVEAQHVVATMRLADNPAEQRVLEELLEASISRLYSGGRAVDPTSKEGELALLLVRVYRSLDALVGTDATQRKAWLRGHNRALNGRPVDLLERADGLVSVVAYLDAMRAPA